MQTYDIIIIGAGPAGTATARALSRLAPGLAARTLMIDATAHPRKDSYQIPVTGASLKMLTSLDLDIEIPASELTRARFRFGEHYQDIFFESPWMLVQRDTLDAWLFHQTAQAVEARMDERVVSISLEGDHVRVETTQRSYRARMVIGADGASGLVRDHIWRHHHDDDDATPRHRAIAESLSFAAAHAGTIPLETQGCLEYDFTPLSKGINGYVWHTPDILNEASVIHAGLVLRDPSTQATAPATLLEGWLEQQRWTPRPDTATVTHYKNGYDPSIPLSSPRAILVGEAAGIGPLLGDGFWQCLEYGCLAAHVANEAFEQGDFNMTGYSESVQKSTLGREMLASQKLNERLLGGDWRFWVSWLVNRPGLSSLLTRQESGVEAVHQKKIYLTFRGLLHRLIGDKRLPSE